MNPVDEYAQHMGHLFVEWRRTDAKVRQLDGQFRATAAELQKAQAELETRPKAAEPVATSRLCAWCDIAVVVAIGQTPAYAMGNHVATCEGSPLTSARLRIEEEERKLEYQRNEFFAQEKRYRKLLDAARSLRASWSRGDLSAEEHKARQTLWVAVLEFEPPTTIHEMPDDSEAPAP